MNLMEARGCIGGRVGVGGEGMTTRTTFVGSEEEREVNLNELNSPSEFNE